MASGVTHDFKRLAYQRAFDYVPSTAPDMPVRVYLPVPRWLRKGGGLLKKHKHPNVALNDERHYVFHFTNPKDKSAQSVRVDGSGIIGMDGMPRRALQDFMNAVSFEEKGLNHFGGRGLVRLLREAERKGVTSVFTIAADKALEGMDVWDQPLPNYIYGGFTPTPVPSSAIGYRRVTFKMPDGSKIEKRNPCFITFPGITAEELKGAGGRKNIAALCRMKAVEPVIVDALAFKGTYQLKTGGAVSFPICN